MQARVAETTRRPHLWSSINSLNAVFIGEVAEEHAVDCLHLESFWRVLVFVQEGDGGGRLNVPVSLAASWWK